MTTRRELCKTAATASLLGVRGGANRLAGESASGGGSASASAIGREPASPSPTGAEDRAYWCGMASRLARPVLGALAARELKARMPVRFNQPGAARERFAHLEALGRLLVGVAPWLELGGDETPEGRERAQLAELAREAIDAGTDPASPDYMNFTVDRQPLVDAAFLAEAMLRAPTELWAKLDSRVKAQVIAALRLTYPIPPFDSNWTLFATMVEVFFRRVGEPWDEARLVAGLHKHDTWYVGDGTYGDGPEYHWDYYNSYVIQPMLVESLELLAPAEPSWHPFLALAQARLTRYAAVQERLIAPDGTFPVIGRSIVYRGGAFQALALAAWRDWLPPELPPAQVRVALTAMIRATLDDPANWDDAGWLHLGLNGHQPSLAEDYICTGSLYLCSAALLPLGLAAEHAFWLSQPAPTTWAKAWGGVDLPADKARRERR